MPTQTKSYRIPKWLTNEIDEALTLNPSMTATDFVREALQYKLMRHNPITAMVTRLDDQFYYLSNYILGLQDTGEFSETAQDTLIAVNKAWEALKASPHYIHEVLPTDFPEPLNGIDDTED